MSGWGGGGCTKSALLSRTTLAGKNPKLNGSIMKNRSEDPSHHAGTLYHETMKIFQSLCSHGKFSIIDIWFIFKSLI